MPGRVGRAFAILSRMQPAATPPRVPGGVFAILLVNLAIMIVLHRTQPEGTGAAIWILIIVSVLLIVLKVAAHIRTPRREAQQHRAGARTVCTPIPPEAPEPDAEGGPADAPPEEDGPLFRGVWVTIVPSEDAPTLPPEPWSWRAFPDDDELTEFTIPAPYEVDP